MSIGLIFWVIMLLWILAWVGDMYAPNQYPFARASTLMFFILFFLLGWHDFGFIVQGGR